MELKLIFDHTKLTLGAKFYEASWGKLCEYTVTKEPVIGSGYEGCPTLSWEGTLLNDDKPTPFLITMGYEHYGPKIFLEEDIAYIGNRRFLAR